MRYNVEVRKVLHFKLQVEADSEDGALIAAGDLIENLDPDSESVEAAAFEVDNTGGVF